MWVVYALIVTVTWGIGDVLAKKGLKKISPVWNNLLAVVFAVGGWVPFALSRGANFLAITLIIIGTFLISIEEFMKILTNRKYRGNFHTSWLFWGFLGGIANGVGDFFSKVGVMHR